MYEALNCSTLVFDDEHEHEEKYEHEAKRPAPFDFEHLSRK